MADATSKRAASISVPLRNLTDTEPEPFLDAEDMSVTSRSPANTPSILEVASLSTTSGEALR